MKNVDQFLLHILQTNALLTCETFLSVIKNLFSHECLLIQRKSMELLNWRLQQSKDGVVKDEFSTKDLISLIPKLMVIVGTISNEKEGDSFDQKLNQQIALISIKLLTKHCKNMPKYYDKLKTVGIFGAKNQKRWMKMGLI